MELKDLRALVTIVRTGSFTAAAAELGYTQSAVSQQIRALEQELGRPLLERRPLRPTAAGGRLIEHAERILMRVDVAQTELAALESSGPALRVSACPLAVPDMLALALRMIRRESPSLRITLASTTPTTAVEALAAGDVDVAVVDGITGPDNPLSLAEPGLLEATGLVEESLVVVLPGSHPMARRRWIDLAMLTDAPWVAARDLPSSLSTGDRSFEVQEPADLTMLLTLVAANHGSALLPATSPLLAPGVTAVPLRRPELVHRSEVLTRRDPALPAAALVERLRELARERRSAAAVR